MSTSLLIDNAQWNKLAAACYIKEESEGAFLVKEGTLATLVFESGK